MESSKNFDRARFIMSSITLIFVLILDIWGKYYGPTMEEEVFKQNLPLQFYGRVDSIYRDKANHDVKYIVLSNGYKYGVEADWEDSIDLGDSLSKTKGQLKILVFKKADTI